MRDCNCFDCRLRKARENAEVIPAIPEKQVDPTQCLHMNTETKHTMQRCCDCGSVRMTGFDVFSERGEWKAGQDCYYRGVKIEWDDEAPLLAEDEEPVDGREKLNYSWLAWNARRKSKSEVIETIYQDIDETRKRVSRCSALITGYEKTIHDTEMLFDSCSDEKLVHQEHLNGLIELLNLARRQ